MIRKKEQERGKLLKTMLKNLKREMYSI